MKIKRAYKFRLKTDKKIEEKLVLFAGHSRFVWNKARGWCIDRLERGFYIFRYHELCFWLKLWKNSEEYKFLKDCHSQILQQKLKDLDRAFMDAFDKNQSNKKLPRLKKRGRHNSFRYTQGFKIDNKRVYLPKIGWVKFYKSCDIKGVPKNITVSEKGNHWYISIQVETEIQKSTNPNATSIIGIDMGINFFAMPSNGKGIRSKNSFKKYERKLKIEQRKLSKKKNRR